MILTENHRIKRNRNKELFNKIDAYCYSAKNLSNSVQYLICQCYRIHQKIRNEEMKEPWEQEILDDINNALGTELDSEDYDSIGGLMIENLDRLPKNGEVVTLDNGITLKARGVKRNRITKVLMTVNTPVENEDKETL